MAATFPKLVVLTGPEEGQEFALTGKGVVFLGRADENDFALEDNSVSRVHVSIAFRDGAYYVKDENSRNGTYLESQKLADKKEVKLTHLDIIRLGVYDLRYLEKDVTEKDIQAKIRDATDKSRVDISSEVPEMPEPSREPSEQNIGDKLKKEQSAAPAPQEKEAATALEKKHPDEESTDVEALVAVSETTPAPKKSRRWFRLILVVFLLSALAAAAYQYRYFILPRDSQQDPIAKLPKDHVPIDPYAIPSKDLTDSTTDLGSVMTLTQDSPKTDAAILRDFNIFLDVKTEPLPATIYLGEKRLGVAPLKQNVSVKPGELYTVYADFELRELNDIYRKKIEFRAKPDSDVVELDITSEIGLLKIQKLPRRVDFYLEGYYDYDKLKANPVKITNIVYGKPIYLPYGHYLIELRERTKVAGSDNETIQIRYQREYNVSAENTVLELNVTDNDLQFFPAVIKSNPSNANVYYAGEKVGVTPYTGNLPLGTNQLKLTKEGFFDAVVDIDMRMNSIYETTITLQTSKIGELINKAGEQMRNQQVDDAIATLVDALKYGGSSHEKAQTYLLLGDAYYSKADYEQAIPYYEKAGTESEFEILSDLGLARCYNMLKNYQEALKTIVSVLVNLTPKTPIEQRMEANNVFKKISPFKSVIYINTTPAGAVVFSNDKKVTGQVTPLILYDRDMGNYRLEIQKPGYETFQTKVNLKIAEFVIVNVDLKAEQL